MVCVEGSVGDSVGSSVAQVLPLHPNNNNNNNNNHNNNNNNITNVETRLGAVGDSLVHRGVPVSEASAEIVRGAVLATGRTAAGKGSDLQ